LTKKFAAAVLLGQAAIVLATAVVLALSKRISSSWSSVGGLITLAIDSNPTPWFKNMRRCISIEHMEGKGYGQGWHDERLQMGFEHDGTLDNDSKPGWVRNTHDYRHSQKKKNKRTKENGL
jgi:hypothetical protein